MATPDPFVTSIDYVALGNRFRAHRIGASLLAEDVAECLGVSRSVVYRMEKGEFVKIETIERLARLLGTSLASLLGVEVEYYASLLGFMERMRQLEATSTRIIAHFEPISLLLISDEYFEHLRTMLLETAADSVRSRNNDAVPIQKLTWAEEVDQIIAILKERKSAFEKNAPNIVSLIGLRDLERFIYTGLVGHLDLPESVRKERIAAARREVARIAQCMENEPLHVHIGLIDDAMPSSIFQLFVGAEQSFVATSPYRLGELPNVRNGIATVTASAEAIRLHEVMIKRLWLSAYKGKAGADRLYQMLESFS